MIIPGTKDGDERAALVVPLAHVGSRMMALAAEVRVNGCNLAAQTLALAILEDLERASAAVRTAAGEQIARTDAA